MATSSVYCRNIKRPSDEALAGACVVLLVLTACAAPDTRDQRQPSQTMRILHELAYTSEFSNPNVIQREFGVELTDFGGGRWLLQPDTKPAQALKSISLQESWSGNNSSPHLSITLDTNRLCIKTQDILDEFGPAHQVLFLPLPEFLPSSGTNIGGIQYELNGRLVFRATFYRQICAHALEILEENKNPRRSQDH